MQLNLNDSLKIITQICNGDFLGDWEWRVTLLGKEMINRDGLWCQWKVHTIHGLYGNMNDKIFVVYVLKNLVSFHEHVIHNTYAINQTDYKIMHENVF